MYCPRSGPECLRATWRMSADCSVEPAGKAAPLKPHIIISQFFLKNTQFILVLHVMAPICSLLENLLLCEFNQLRK